MGKRRIRIYTRGPRKNAILIGTKPSKLSRISVASFKLNNLIKKHIKSYLLDLLLFNY